jgi:CRP/FNR family transcriptional regulator
MIEQRLATRKLDIPGLSARLGQVPHFSHLSDTDCEHIVRAGQIQFFQKDAYIFQEGDDCAGLFVLFKGRVNLSKLGLQGQNCILSVIRPVIMFNEVAILDGGPNPLSAVAVQDCATWRLSHESFMMLMTRYPEVGTGLLRVLATRFRAMINQYEDLLSRPVCARAAKVILELSDGGQKPISRQRHPNQELAALAATGPEVLSRSLRKLREAGVIKCTRSRITVLLRDRLMEMALLEPEYGLFSEN